LRPSYIIRLLTLPALVLVACWSGPSALAQRQTTSTPSVQVSASRVAQGSSVSLTAFNFTPLTFSSCSLVAEATGQVYPLVCGQQIDTHGMVGLSVVIPGSTPTGSYRVRVADSAGLSGVSDVLTVCQAPRLQPVLRQSLDSARPWCLQAQAGWFLQ
jgi:hypothetical protein